MRLFEHEYQLTRQLLKLSPEDLKRVIGDMSESDRRLAYTVLKFDWNLWQRPTQVLPPGDWKWCAALCGRSWGKTRLSSELLRETAESGEHEYVALCGPTFTIVQRDNITGPSGILKISPPWFKPEYWPSKFELRWPKHPITGVKMRCSLFSGDKADRIRGAEVSRAFLDEIATWTEAEESWMNIDLMLRRGDYPQGFISSTLKRRGPGTGFSRDLMWGKRGSDGVRHQREDIVIIRGETKENFELSKEVIAGFYRSFGGTADAVTELEGGLAKEAEGALWIFDTLEQHRVQFLPPGVTITRLLLSVDPTRSRVGTGDLCGIITLALGSDNHIYILSDDSLRAAPEVWIQRAVACAEKQRVDGVIYEQNRLDQGLMALIREAARPYNQSWIPVTATGEKIERADPVAALYRAGRVHHVGYFPELEEEQCAWDPKEKNASPDRLDALVHGVVELLLSKKASRPKLAVR